MCFHHHSLPSSSSSHCVMQRKPHFLQPPRAPHSPPSGPRRASSAKRWNLRVSRSVTLLEKGRPPSRAWPPCPSRHIARSALPAFLGAHPGTEPLTSTCPGVAGQRSSLVPSLSWFSPHPPLSARPTHSPSLPRQTLPRLCRPCAHLSLLLDPRVLGSHGVSAATTCVGKLSPHMQMLTHSQHACRASVNTDTSAHRRVGTQRVRHDPTHMGMARWDFSLAHASRPPCNSPPPVHRGSRPPHPASSTSPSPQAPAIQPGSPSQALFSQTSPGSVQESLKGT